jgi:ribulose-phosphate 3-epimerase
MINAPSLFNCSALDLPLQLAELVAAGIKLVHVDVMDGHYVPNLAFPVKQVADIKRDYPQISVDVHLMVTDPEQYFDALIEGGADFISFPSDSTRFVRRALERLREAGVKAGVAINPSQRVDVIEPYARLLDYVVLMTVEPGFAGQRFLDGSLERLEELDELRTRTQSGFRIEIDGGVDAELGSQCCARGAEILVTGVFATFEQPDGIRSAVRRFAEAVEPSSR